MYWSHINMNFCFSWDLTSFVDDITCIKADLSALSPGAGWLMEHIMVTRALLLSTSFWLWMRTGHHHSAFCANDAV